MSFSIFFSQDGNTKTSDMTASPSYGNPHHDEFISYKRDFQDSCSIAACHIAFYLYHIWYRPAGLPEKPAAPEAIDADRVGTHRMQYSGEL